MKIKQMFIITLKWFDYNIDIKNVFQIRILGKNFEDIIKQLEKFGYKDDEILNIAKIKENIYI